MGKRTYMADVTAMALLYRSQCTTSKILSHDKILEFDRIINENLDIMNSSCGIGIRYDCYDESKLFVEMTDEEGKLYAVMLPDANLEDALNIHIGCLPTDVVVASQMSNALDAINLELVDGKFKDKQKNKVKVYKYGK